MTNPQPDNVCVQRFSWLLPLGVLAASAFVYTRYGFQGRLSLDEALLVLSVVAAAAYPLHRGRL